MRTNSNYLRLVNSLLKSTLQLVGDLHIVCYVESKRSPGYMILKPVDVRANGEAFRLIFAHRITLRIREYLYPGKFVRCIRRAGAGLVHIDLDYDAV